MIIGTKAEFEQLADFILRDYLGNTYDGYDPLDIQAFAKDYLKLDISYFAFDHDTGIEGMRTGNQIILDDRLLDDKKAGERMVKLRSICQAVNDIRTSDPGTAMTEGFLRLLIENGDVSYEICGSRVCINIAILFKELACLFELESATMPKLRTIKGALKEIKATDPESFMTDYKIRWLIKSGRLRSYAVGSREIIVMESFNNENLLTQESREGSNITQGIKLSEQYSELLSKTTQSYTCTRRR